VSYAATAADGEIDSEQIEEEKARVYAPLEVSGDSMGWKELNAGICRIMQDYCGQYKSEETLQVGLQLLGDVRKSEASKVSAANPHELARAMECHSIITAGEAVIQASLARKASSAWLNFTRLDYPSVDPPEWNKLLAIKQKNGEVCVTEMPLDYHLQAPYAATYEENYQQHSDL
jgi:succinate dehydrogenase/fumarate reductase flavoprotein subunit